MQAPRKIAVTGATGRLGRHVVDVLGARGHEVVPMSRTSGVDVVTGKGLAEALQGVEAVIDTATYPTPDQQAATDFFLAAAHNLHTLGEQAGVERMVEVSIIGTDRHTGGYGKAKAAQEQAMLAGPIPVTILRASQFHEFVTQLLDWSRQGDVAYIPKFRTQPVAARTAAEALADLALESDSAPEPGPDPRSFREIAGPREENLADLARRLTAKRGDALTIQEVTELTDPDRRLQADGGALPSPHAKLAGPTFEEWLAVGL